MNAHDRAQLFEAIAGGVLFFAFMVALMLLH
jgi:hypothetical protein